jgi:hypothetical protein
MHGARRPRGAPNGAVGNEFRTLATIGRKFLVMFSRTERRHWVVSNVLGGTPPVELNGIEPSTSGLQSPRSPS